MKMILIATLLALAGCAGSKPAVGQANNTDNKQCKAIENILERDRKLIAMPASISDCECHETTICEGIEYCISAMCDGHIVQILD
jgi:hypothetical protein